MPRGDRLLIGFLCSVILFPILKEYAQVKRCSRSLLRMPRGDRPLVGFHCLVALALPIKDGTPVECCPSVSLSGSLLMCILSHLTLRVAGGLSGRFFSLLARFVPGLLNVIIALSAAFLLWREGISHFC